MLYNNIVFLSDNLELSCEKPQNLLAEVKYNGSENFGNYHTSYFPIEKKGKELVFNGWSLKEFYINRQWSKSYLLKLLFQEIICHILIYMIYLVNTKRLNGLIVAKVNLNLIQKCYVMRLISLKVFQKKYVLMPELIFI